MLFYALFIARHKVPVLLIYDVLAHALDAILRCVAILHQAIIPRSPFKSIAWAKKGDHRYVICCGYMHDGSIDADKET